MTSCLESIAELDGSFSEREVILVDNASVGVQSILTTVGSWAKIVRLPQRVCVLDALRAGVRLAAGETVICLPSPACPAADSLAAMCTALEQAVAVTSVDPAASQTHPTQARAIALRRASMPTVEVAGDQAMGALCLELAKSGPVVPCPAAHVTRCGEVHYRRGPGLEPVELSVIVPTLDAASRELSECLRNVQATVCVPHEIIVVDNGAPPQGFTAPVNAGLRAARGERIVVMNDDVEVLDGWWEPLSAALDAGDPVVFPQTIEGEMRWDFAAWCFAMRRTDVERLASAPGEFYDLDMLVWCQDLDLRNRLRSLGTPPKCIPESRIRHVGSRTMEVIASRGPLWKWVHEQRIRDLAVFLSRYPAEAQAWRERRIDRGEPTTAEENREIALSTQPIALQADGPVWQEHFLPWPQGVEHFSIAGEVVVESDTPVGDLLAHVIFGDDERELFWMSLVPGVLETGRRSFTLAREAAKPIPPAAGGRTSPTWSAVSRVAIRTKSRLRGRFGAPEPGLATALTVNHLHLLVPLDDRVAVG
ncbi:MAG TPA: glycosyltransferase [Solirubrobacteraceae bacterium]|nr:glycosyltransferase [Solirubrobacteraceae bacterium]